MQVIMILSISQSSIVESCSIISSSIPACCISPSASASLRAFCISASKDSSDEISRRQGLALNRISSFFSRFFQTFSFIHSSISPIFFSKFSKLPLNSSSSTSNCTALSSSFSFIYAEYFSCLCL